VRLRAAHQVFRKQRARTRTPWCGVSVLLANGYRTVWQALGTLTLTVDNTIKSETEGFFTEEDNDQYLTPYLTQIYGPRFRFNGKIYDR